MATTSTVSSMPHANEVLTFATKNGADKFLQPVLEMTTRVFPDARGVDAVLDVDPEIVDDRHIVVEVQLNSIDVQQSVDRHWEWSRQLLLICPPTHACFFGLHVNLNDE